MALKLDDLYVDPHGLHVMEIYRKCLQTTISNLIKMVESSPSG